MNRKTLLICALSSVLSLSIAVGTARLLIPPRDLPVNQTLTTSSKVDENSMYIESTKPTSNSEDKHQIEESESPVVDKSPTPESSKKPIVSSSPKPIQKPKDDIPPVIVQPDSWFKMMVDEGCPICGSSSCGTFNYDDETVDSKRCEKYNRDKDASISCPICGKKTGNGTNRTCSRTNLGDSYCYYCGEFVKNGECHTCKE